MGCGASRILELVVSYRVSINGEDTSHLHCTKNKCDSHGLNGYHTVYRTVAWTTGSTSILGWHCPFFDVGRRADRTHVFEPTGNGRVNVVWNSPVNLFQHLRQLQPCPGLGTIHPRLSRSVIGNDRNRHVAGACARRSSWPTLRTDDTRDTQRLALASPFHDTVLDAMLS